MFVADGAFPIHSCRHKNPTTQQVERVSQAYAYKSEVPNINNKTRFSAWLKGISWQYREQQNLRFTINQSIWRLSFYGKHHKAVLKSPFDTWSHGGKFSIQDCLALGIQVECSYWKIANTWRILLTEMDAQQIVATRNIGIALVITTLHKSSPFEP